MAINILWTRIATTADSDEEDDDGGMAGPSVIEEEEDGLGSARARDDMKWPAGDGWRSLH